MTILPETWKTTSNHKSRRKTFDYITFESTLNYLFQVIRKHKPKHSKRFEKHITEELERVTSLVAILHTPSMQHTNNLAEANHL